jgi:hypothetical protein
MILEEMEKKILLGLVVKAPGLVSVKMAQVRKLHCPPSTRWPPRRLTAQSARNRVGRRTRFG